MEAAGPFETSVVLILLSEHTVTQQKTNTLSLDQRSSGILHTV